MDQLETAIFNEVWFENLSHFNEISITLQMVGIVLIGCRKHGRKENSSTEISSKKLVERNIGRWENPSKGKFVEKLVEELTSKANPLT